jgi:hypothetical protein
MWLKELFAGKIASRHYRQIICCRDDLGNKRNKPVKVFFFDNLKGLI